MNINWETLSHPPLQFENYLPVGFTGLHWPGSKILSAEGKFGNLSFQSYTQSRFCIQYSVVTTNQSFLLQARTTLKGLFARIMLENHVEHKVKGSETLIIREGQFSMMTGIAPEARLLYKRPDQYSSLEAFFSMPMLNKVIGRFPAMQSFFSQQLSHQPTIILSPKPADTATQQVIGHLLKNPADLKQAEELLETLMAQLEEKRKLKKPPPAEQLEKIYEAERVIADDIRNHYLIPDIARRAKTNQCTLKTIFPYVFGLSPYKYLMRKRMRLAYKLLLLKTPVKNVAVETGFKTNAEFTKAFKHYFNIRPSDLLNQ